MMTIVHMSKTNVMQCKTIHKSRQAHKAMTYKSSTANHDACHSGLILAGKDTSAGKKSSSHNELA